MNTWLLEFKLKPDDLHGKHEEILDRVKRLVAENICKCHVVYKNFGHLFTALLANEQGVSVLLQGMPSGTFTVDINIAENGIEVSNEAIRILEDKIRYMPSAVQRKTPEFLSLPSIERGREFSRYDIIGSGLIERDFDRVAFDDVSPYQHVRIMHSPQYGNVLFLDNDLNLAESDLEYTRAITGYDQEDYTDKTVLVLGGGDGGILHYLRDKGPSMITMIDIDQMVIDAAKVHLRGICFDALDSLEGKNYKVIVDDCIKYLGTYVKEGRKFDYVINDLTAIPVSTEPVGDHWDFLRRILALSMQVLDDRGKYFTQGNSQIRRTALAMYEAQLKKLDCPVKFETRVVCVPSYLENWVFYTIWKNLSS